MSTIYTIDGASFDTLDGFFHTIGNQVIPGKEWGRNLDALNHVLRGDFGTPEDGFTLVWKNADQSKEKLGFKETAKFMKEILKTCQPEHREQVQAQIELAESERGATIFDWLIEIIRDHGMIGSQSKSNINLILE